MQVIRPTRGCLLRRSGRCVALSRESKPPEAPTRTAARDRRRSVGRRARSIASKLRLRGQQQRDQAQAAVRRITGELAEIAEAGLPRGSRRCCATPNVHCELRPGTRKGRLQQAINHLTSVVAAHPAGGGANPQPLGWGDARVSAPGGQLARCRRSSDPQRTAGQTGRVRLQGPDRRQRRRSHPRPQHRDRKPARRTATGAGDPADHPPNRAPTPRSDRRSRLRRRVGRTRPARLGVAPRGDPAQRANPAPAAANSNTDEPSATRSNGAPDPKDGSTTSNAATAGTAPTSPASMAPEPGADTASSPTTSSRSAPSRHEPPPHTPAVPPTPPRRDQHHPTYCFSGLSS